MKEEQLVTNEYQPQPNPPDSIGISLSGGGHRAALFAAGAVLAVIDAGLADRVQWIASASGGSLTSAYILAHGGLVNIAADPDSFARSVLSICNRRAGSFGRLSFLELARAAPGKALEHSLTRIWLHADAPLKSFNCPGPEHVFLAVNLGVLQPVYISRELVFGAGLDDEGPMIGSPGTLTLAAVARASSAFPLLPSVKVRRQSLELYELSSNDRTIVLADGGLWNNLATTWYEKQAAVLSQVHHALSPALKAKVAFHLAADASAPVRRRSSILLEAPLLGWGFGAYRCVKAMLQSTLAYQHDQLGWHSQWNAGLETAHINLHMNPHDVCPRQALMDRIGQDKDGWYGIARRASRARTTLCRIDHMTAISVVSQAYGLTAAHLAQGWSIPFARFSDPMERLR